jgi:hypothetical protein
MIYRIYDRWVIILVLVLPKENQVGKKERKQESAIAEMKFFIHYHFHHPISLDESCSLPSDTSLAIIGLSCT